MLIPLTCPANKWTTLPPPICAPDIQRLTDAAETIRSEHTEDDLRGMEPVIQVWFSCDCVFTQDSLDGYVWLPSDFSDSIQVQKKIRVALMDGSTKVFSREIPWPEPDDLTKSL